MIYKNYLPFFISVCILFACQSHVPENEPQTQITTLDAPKIINEEQSEENTVLGINSNKSLGSCIFNDSQNNSEQVVMDLGINTELWHYWRHGFSILLGQPESQKYKQGNWKSGWATPDCIPKDDTKNEDWKRGRCFVWNEGTTAPMRFFLPKHASNPNKNWILVLRLFPKINNRVDIRLNQFGLIDSVPLRGGWETVEITIPNEKFNWGGENTLNFAFLGSYFQDNIRVAAKFDYVYLVPEETRAMLKTTVPEPITRLETARILRRAQPAFGLVNDDEMRAYFYVPENATFHTEIGPSEWLQTTMQFELAANTDIGEKKVLSQGQIQAGDCWRALDINLNDFQNTAIELSLKVWQTDALSKLPNYKRPTAYVANSKITQPRQNDEVAKIASIIRKNTKTILYITIDGLRADRIFAKDKTRSTPFIRSLLENSISFTTLANGAGGITNAVSLLYGVGSQKHAVFTPQTHIKQSYQSLAERFATYGYWTGYYSNNSFTSPKLGFAQGFSETFFAADSEFGNNTARLLELIAQKIRSQTQKSFFYIQLSELRLPWNGKSANIQAFSPQAYTGVVTPQALQNPAALRNLNNADKQQLDAYYDAELLDIDEDLKSFVTNLPDDTLLILTGTHGTALGEDALIGYGNSLSPAELLTPTLLYLKGHKITKQLPNLYNSIDIYASITDLFTPTNIQSNIEDVDGKSIFSAEKPTLPEAFSETHRAIAQANDFYLLRTGDKDNLTRWSLNNMQKQEDIKDKNPIAHRAMRDLIH